MKPLISKAPSSSDFVITPCNVEQTWSTRYMLPDTCWTGSMLSAICCSSRKKNHHNDTIQKAGETYLFCYDCSNKICWSDIEGRVPHWYARSGNLPPKTTFRVEQLLGWPFLYDNLFPGREGEIDGSHWCCHIELDTMVLCRNSQVVCADLVCRITLISQEICLTSEKYNITLIWDGMWTHTIGGYAISTNNNCLNTALFHECGSSRICYQCCRYFVMDQLKSRKSRSLENWH
jgi:hypothetical protein